MMQFSTWIARWQPNEYTLFRHRMRGVQFIGPDGSPFDLAWINTPSAVPEDKLPALVLLDGKEAIKVPTSSRGGALAPMILTLEPQVFVVLKPRVAIMTPPTC